jgi:hypothetical protein
MAVFSTTEAAYFLPTIWSKDIIAARDAALFMRPRVANVSGQLKRGQVLRIPVTGLLTAGSVTAATGGYTSISDTASYKDVTVNQWYHANITVVDNLETLADRDIAKTYAPMQGQALALEMDGQLLSNYAQFSQVGGGTVTDASVDVLVTAASTLDNSNVPKEDRHCALSPAQYWKILGENAITDASALGTAKSALISAKLPNLCGFEMLSTTQIPTSTTRRHFCWHKSAIALAVSNEVSMEKIRMTGYLATEYRCWHLYGYQVARTDHGLIIDTTNTA